MRSAIRKGWGCLGTISSRISGGFKDGWTAKARTGLIDETVRAAGDRCGLGAIRKGQTNQIIKTMRKSVEHQPVVCMRPGCENEATRFYEELDKPFETFYVCLEHPDVQRRENTFRIRNSAGKLVELCVYQCQEDCEVCP